MSDQISNTLITAVTVVFAAVTNLYLVAAAAFALLAYNLANVLVEFTFVVKRIPFRDRREDIARYIAVAGFFLFMVLRVFGIAL